MEFGGTAHLKRTARAAALERQQLALHYCKHLQDWLHCRYFSSCGDLLLGRAMWFTSYSPELLRPISSHSSPLVLFRKLGR
jgi:hypothetical protein